MTKHYTHEEIEALLDASTPGEWYEKDHDAFVKTAEGFELRITKVNHYNDVPFIAAAPAIVRQLLEEINQELKESHREACKYESKISDLMEQIDGYLQFIDEQRRLIEDLDDKRETAVRMLRQSEKRIEQLKTELKADPLSNVPPFDWGPEGVSEGAQING